jgi:hypothetical protein
MKTKILFLWMLLLPGAATSFAQDASGTCGENLTWTLSEGTLTISGTGEMTNSPWSSYKEDITAVVVELGVESIGYAAFSNCSGLVSVTLPESIIFIENDAFSWCSGLESIILPESVTSIGNYAFYACSSLESVALSELIISIGEHAFSNCGHLVSITIPTSVTSIGYGAFFFCHSLIEITVASNNPYYSSDTGILFDKNKATLIQYPAKKTDSSYTIPSSVTSIGDYAFYGLHLESITLPETLTSIGEGTFSDCHSLESITLPSSVTSIGNSAFSFCSSLVSINIPASVTFIGSGAFHGCLSLTEITVTSNNLSYCSEDGILFNKNKTTLMRYPSKKTGDSYAIQESVTSIEFAAFSYCNNLTSVYIPETVTSIGTQAFGYCSNLKSVLFSPASLLISTGMDTFFGCSSLESITFPELITSIGHSAFGYCSSLKSINIPEKVTSIEVQAFWQCYDLTEIMVNWTTTPPAINNNVFMDLTLSNITLHVPDGTKAMYEAAEVWKEFNIVEQQPCPSGTFGEGGALTWELCEGTLTISGTGAMPDYNRYSGDNSPWYSYRDIRAVIVELGITSIGSDAFDECSNLESITISESVTSIGYEAFFSCRSLKSITLPETLTIIGRYTFRSCSSLESITLPKSVTSIGEGAFLDCISLESIIIPETVTFIGNEPFARCINLTEITVASNNPSYSSEAGVLFDKNKTKLIQYPVGKTDNSYIIPETVISIGEFAFGSCNSLTSVTIPGSVTSIGFAAFYFCSNLTSITIPETVTSIGNLAFDTCISLTEITIASNNPSYSSEAGVLFDKNKTTIIQYPAGRTSNSYTIPESVTSIGIDAFTGCINLESLIIPESVTSIASFAFQECSSLANVTVNWTAMPPAISDIVFWILTLPDITLHVPFGTKAIYEGAEIWKEFNIVESPVSHWLANYRQYPNTMIVTSVVELNGAELQSDRIEIGAFADEECRGSAIVQYSPEVERYLGFLTVHGNGGENITFKVYNQDTGKEYEAINHSPDVFVADAIYGTPDAPHTIIISESATQEILLNDGWTWISVNITNAANSLLDQFKNSIEGAGIALKSLDKYIQAPYWVGTLTEINNTEMYMVGTNTEAGVSFTGLPVNPATVPIPLLSGWNWIGYTPAVGMTVDEAFAGISLQIDDQIKSYSDYSVYTEQGWVGTLTQMSPGNGYKYFSNSAAPQVLTYSSSMQTASALYSNEETGPRHWTAAAHRYPNTMTVTSVVLLNKVELRNGTIEIGAFSGDECRGSVVLQHFAEIAGHSYLGFLVIYGEDNEEIQLRVYDPATGEEYPATSLSFVADAIHGTPSNPYMIEADFTGVQTVADEAAIYLKQDGDRLQIRHPWESIDRIELLGLNGNTLFLKTGFTAKSIDISSLATGVYIVKLTKNNRTYVKKFVKQ